MSQPGLGDATPEQVALAVDGFMGMRLHVVVTLPGGDGGTRVDGGPDDLVARWATYVRRSSRVHVLPVTGVRHRRGARRAAAAPCLCSRGDAESSAGSLKLAKQRRSAGA